MNGELKLGMQVTVVDCGGEVITHGKIENYRVCYLPVPRGYKRDEDDDGPCEGEFYINGQWYKEYMVNCAVCGSDMVCPQCGAEQDLSGMMYA